MEPDNDMSVLVALQDAYGSDDEDHDRPDCSAMGHDAEEPENDEACGAEEELAAAAHVAHGGVPDADVAAESESDHMSDATECVGVGAESEVDWSVDIVSEDIDDHCDFPAFVVKSVGSTAAGSSNSSAPPAMGLCTTPADCKRHVPPRAGVRLQQKAAAQLYQVWYPTESSSRSFSWGKASTTSSGTQEVAFAEAVAWLWEKFTTEFGEEKANAARAAKGL